MILCAYHAADTGAGMHPLAPEQGSAAVNGAANAGTAELTAALTPSGATSSALT